MLSSHRRIAITPETHFLTEHWRLQRKLDLSQPANFENVIRQFVNTKRFADIGVSEEHIRERFYRNADLTFQGLFTSILKSHADDKHKPRHGEKTPGHYQHLETLLAWYPKARIVFLIRDPRAVVASSLVAPFANPYAWFHARRWRRAYREYLRWRHDDRVLAVRYEDLVSATRKTLEQICKFLGEDYDPAMESSDQPVEVDQRGEWQKEHHHSARQPVTTASIQKWRRELSEAECAIVELYNGPAMHQLGYETSPGNPRWVAVILWSLDYPRGRLDLAVRAAIHRKSVNTSPRGNGIKDHGLVMFGAIQTYASYVFQYTNRIWTERPCKFGSRLHVFQHQKRAATQATVAWIDAPSCQLRRAKLRALQRLLPQLALEKYSKSQACGPILIVSGNLNKISERDREMIWRYAAKGGRIALVEISLESRDPDTPKRLARELRDRGQVDHAWVLGDHTRDVLVEAGIECETIGLVGFPQSAKLQLPRQHHSELGTYGIEIDCCIPENPYRETLTQHDEVIGLSARKLVEGGQTVCFIAKTLSARVRAKSILKAFHLGKHIRIGSPEALRHEPFQMACAQSEEIITNLLNYGIPLVYLGQSWKNRDLLSAYRLESFRIDPMQTSSFELTERMIAAARRGQEFQRTVREMRDIYINRQNRMASWLISFADPAKTIF